MENPDPVDSSATHDAAGGPEGVTPEPSRSFGRAFWHDWVRPFVIVLVALSTFRSAVADWNHVPTGSMEPTILIGDRIFVNKLAYDLKVPFTRLRLLRWSAPQRGDVVVFLSPHDGKRLVKRVIGLPSDEVEMTNNRLRVNGQPALYEPLAEELDSASTRFAGGRHLATETLTNGAPHSIQTRPDRPSPKSFATRTVPEGHYFVMGDNRDDSSDSRDWGFVPESLILGRATAVALSVDPDHFYRPRWQRFLSDLP